jgi:hypothetical protein
MTKMSRLAVAATIAVSIHVVAIAADQLASGRNVNVHPGIADQYVGDIYLQRQVEPKIVCSSTNPQHCVAMANDYRTVDATADSSTGLGEGVAKLRLLDPGSKSYVAAAADAWLGLYRTSNGGQNWLNGLIPGFPFDTSQLGTSQPWFGLAAGSDAGLASDGVHFFGVGLFFNRGGFSMVGAFRLTDYNDESANPIRWDAGFSRALEQGSSTATGQFADLPSVVATPAPAGGCGNVYVAYTLFAGSPTNNSFINFVKSTDCGNKWTKPMKIQGNFKKNQRVTLVMDPRPAAQGGGTLYAAWRTFGPDQIAGTRSTDGGNTWTPAIAITPLNGPANLCTYDQPTIATTNNGMDFQTARGLAFPSFQVDSAGQIFAVWTERVNAAGLPQSGAACTTALAPKIVITRSSNGGVSWTTRQAIDMGNRCETQVGVGQAAGLDRSSPNGGQCPAGTISRAAGPQIQPVLSHNAGKLMVVYSEGRVSAARPNGLDSFGWHSGRNSQVDVRAAQIDPTTGLLSTTQVSLYTYDVNTNDIKGVENAPNSKAYNRPYLPQYKGGTTPFKGDHDDLVPAEAVVWGTTPHYATAAEIPGARFFTMFGGDNRESLFPGGPVGDISGNWAAYENPGTGNASSCNAGIRNSNDYFAYVGSPTEAFAHQTFKPTGGIQRTWAVTVRNHSDVTRLYQFTLDQPGGDGSFADKQKSGFDVEVIGNQPTDPFCANSPYPTCTAYRYILPRSSMTFTVFGTIPTSTNAGGPIKVNVSEATLNQTGTVTTTTLAAVVRLNPNPINPAALAGDQIGSKEFHGPSVQGPFVQTYSNPTSGNPTSGNPTSGNPTSGNPTSGNPTSGNTGFSEYTDYQYIVSATDANTLSQYSSFANIANASEIDKSHIVQMIITRTHTTPTLLKTNAGCQLVESPEDEVISIIPVPTSGNLGVPTSGNPTSGNPTSGNPTSGNPTSGNQTFALAPQSAPLVGAATPSNFRATALASLVAHAVSDLASDAAPDGTASSPPEIDQVIVNIRFYHCDGPAGSCGTDKQPETSGSETVPRTQTDPGSDNLIGFATVAGAGNNNNGTITDPPVVAVGPPTITTTSLPGATTGQAYNQTLSVFGGTPSYTWSIASGYLPPGLSLAPATGVISGTPTGCTTTYPFTVQVTDSQAKTDTQDLSIAVTNSITCIAVWADGAPSAGNNGIVSYINTIPGFSATTVSTATLEQPGSLSGYSALYVTRESDFFGTGLTAAAAANVIAFVGAGPVTLFLNDWNDNLPTSNVGDPQDLNTSELIRNAVVRAASGHGYIGEFNGAAMALTANANGYTPLGLIAGSTGPVQSVTCSAVTITSDGAPIQGTVPTNFTPADQTCFSGLATGVSAGNIWVIYDSLGGRPAVIGR